MKFAAPEWFLLIPLLIFLGWYLRSLKLWLPLRALCLVLIVLALARPQIQLLEKGLDLWVLVDRSRSAEADMAAVIDEWEALLRQGQGREDRLRFVDFAEIAIVRSANDLETFPGTGEYTRMALAVEHALNRMPNNRLARMLILTDGYSTEPLTDLGEQLVMQEVPLDYRLTISPELQDYRVTRLRTRQQVQMGEPFVLEVEVSGQPDAEVPLQIFRGSQQLINTTVQVEGGRAVARFTDRLTSPGAHQYIARLPGDLDARPGNNRAGRWVEVRTGPRILLLTNYPDDPVARVLSKQGFSVQVQTEPTAATVGDLSGASAVIINNVPAAEFDQQFLEALPFFVNNQGGGLLMMGGRYSFGTGGYFNSAIDPLLPVSMELREEHRRLATSMAIVMDRSGSMAAGVAGGRTKMDLANEGAANATELLGAQDMISIIAVDSSPHVTVPLTEVGPQRGEIIQRARSIQSMGGGIFVYTGLKAAWNELKGVNVGQKHIILFSDAADSEEPGAYKDLLEEMTDANTTVSVIGLGTRGDVDAAFLEDIAKRGNGRIFFTTDPGTIPTVFAQETVAVARSAFIDQPVALVPLPGWLEIAAKNLDWPPQIDAYNLCYARPEATVAAITADEYQSPLISFWRRGTGRAGAIAFPMAGEHSETIRSWPLYGDFLQTYNRWLMGEELPPGLSVRTAVEGEELMVELLYTEDWEEDISRRTPELLVAGEDGQSRMLTWERLEPGRYEARTRLQGTENLRGAVQVGPHTVPFGPLAAQLDVEWQTDRAALQSLRDLVRLSGGEERLDLSNAWITPERRDYQDIRLWLFLLLVPVALLEFLATRLGWSYPSLHALRQITRAKAGARAKDRKKAATQPPPAATAAKSSPDEPGKESQPDRDREKEAREQAQRQEEESAQRRRSRFSKAKTKRK